jgi:hypothetical protein
VHKRPAVNAVLNRLNPAHILSCFSYSVLFTHILRHWKWGTGKQKVASRRVQFPNDDRVSRYYTSKTCYRYLRTNSEIEASVVLKNRKTLHGCTCTKTHRLYLPFMRACPAQCIVPGVITMTTSTIFLKKKKKKTSFWKA